MPSNTPVSESISRRDKWTSFNRTIGKRDKCDSTCQFFQLCPYSETKSNPSIPAEDAPKCEMANETPDIKRAYMNLFEFGDDGIRDEVFRTVFRAKKLYDPNKVDHMERYAKLLLNVVKQYGGKEELMQTGPVTIDIRGLEPATYTDTVMKPQVLDDGRVVHEDHESLYFSPNIEKIMRKYSADTKPPVPTGPT